MPIYAYKCAECGFEQDVMQKLSDMPLTECPACARTTFAKQLTAAGIQFKGTGYYATDFKNPPAKPAGAPACGASGGGCPCAASANIAASADS